MPDNAGTSPVLSERVVFGEVAGKRWIIEYSGLKCVIVEAWKILVSPGRFAVRMAYPVKTLQEGMPDKM